MIPFVAPHGSDHGRWSGGQRQTGVSGGHAGAVDDAALLAAFDRQVRRRVVAPEPGWVTERVGRVVRTTAPAGTGGSIVEWSGLDAASADAEIAAQVAHFGARRQSFEWKAYGYDQPADLPQRLRAAGFAPGDEESLVIGPTADVAAACRGSTPPDGVVVRPVEPADWPGLAAAHDAVWGGGGAARVDRLQAELAAGHDPLDVFVALAGAVVVGSAWLRCHVGTDVASLWGGGVRPQWRRRGVYRALVARRAELARDRGYPLLQVDALPTSRPVLQRLGLRAVTTTTPYVWDPARHG